MAANAEHPYRGLGIAFVVAGILLNEWIVGYLFSSDGTVDAPVLKAVIWIADIALVLLGLLLFVRREPLDRRQVLFRCWAVALSLVVLECGLRVVDFVAERRREEPQPEHLRSPFRDKEWSKQLLDELNDLAYVSRAFTYHQFLGWDAAEYHGQYVNVDAEGERKTWNPEFEPGAQVPSIYVFGGSTTWGMGARDNDSIPSHLSRLLHAHGHRFMVHNYGDIAYTFTQEFINLILLLKEGHRPDYVVFYDGVNDVYGAYQAGVAGTVINCFHAPEKFDERLTPVRHFWIGTGGLLDKHCLIYRYATKLAHLSEQTPVFPEVAASWNDDQLRDFTEEIADYYSTSQELLEPLSKAYGFKYVTFWQPVTFAEETLLEEERLDIRVSDAALGKIHKHILGVLAEKKLRNFRDLSGALRGRTELYYFDYCHLTGEGNATVAAKICDVFESLFVEQDPGERRTDQ